MRFDSSPWSHTRSWQTLLEVLRYTTSKKGAEYGFGFSQAGSIPSRAPRKSLASEDKVAQELPSYLSGAVTREKPGEKASTGTREYVSYTKTQSR